MILFIKNHFSMLIKMFILYLNKFIYILLLIDYYVIIVKCLPIHDKQLVINQSLTSMIFHNTTYYNVYNKLMTTNGLKDDLWKDNLTPVIGRVIWCINESKQKWLYLDKYGNQNISTNNNNNNNITGKKIILINSGKFYCPQPNQSEDMKYCCGPLGKQICCKITDTPGLRWGIPLGVIVTVIVFLTVSYTIQVFRACDRCYHECPIFTPTPTRLAVNPRFKWKLNKFPNNSSNKTLRQTNQSSNNTNISDLDQKNIDRLSNPNTVTTPWTPWTKVAYIPSLTETSVKKNLTRNSNKSKYKMKNEYKPNQLVNVIILEDIIECNGLDKGVQTHQKRLQTYKTTIDPVV
ncbi:hypothetical protein Smp_161180 [Schistosoma mansoni]|uniref:hypothetical protein n=1 Tax=Schistosoma mansoni TaxID=6183 RepID=UPI00022DC803|nr:hypothetical protein Smp_161180 [Schistosoma mansoni]|eukprot:XP_018650383.1 hypothetical protein Smp_161180 [Schistosoma mansoni]